MSELKPLDRLRLERGATHLHDLGPRAFAELLATLAQRFGGADGVLDAVDGFKHLSPAIMRATGADRFPTRKLRVVP